MDTSTLKPCWDTLFRDALVFDGSGELPRRMDLAVTGGRVAARGMSLPAELAQDTVEAEGRWLMPGLLDIHTHLDLEVELAPGLDEVVRHGTTTVLVGNCSLGTAFGAQRVGDQDPIVDCFARVENIPKHVLRKCAECMDWSSTTDYLAHLDSLCLGPNIAPLIPHSMLRIQVMGLEASIRRAPSESELAQMCTLLENAVQEGYIGFSTDNLPFHYLANDPHRDQRIPTQFASMDELRRLTDILRHHDRVWQATPAPDSPLNTLRRFLLSSGRFRGKPLRLSALAALDFAFNPRGSRALIGMARIINSRLCAGHMHLQALSAPFSMWGDGVTIPIMEEIHSTSRLMALELDDRDGRRRLLDDPEFIASFRDDWTRGKRGFGYARLRSLVGMPLDNFSRELHDIVVDRCPLPEWQGENLAKVYARLQRFQRGSRAADADSDAEARFFDKLALPVTTEADFFLELLRHWDKDLRWRTVIANRDRERIRELLFDRHTLPGFNDSGAHLSNLAFYDGNLLTLQIAAEESMQKLSTAVRRLSRDPAEFFGLDVGRLEIGDQADIILIDPDALREYDSDANRQLVFRADLDNEMLVNRSDGVVTDVYIAGQPAWRNSEVTAALGAGRMGRALTFSGRNPL